jgi:hypothetical protein
MTGVVYPEAQTQRKAAAEESQKLPFSTEFAAVRLGGSIALLLRLAVHVVSQ